MTNSSKFIPFSADVMFCEVMKDEEICRELIERIINRPLDKIVYCNQQETFSSGVNIRSIRLDVCVETKDGTLIDVEMQVGNYSNLPLRFRGYQSILDSTYWKRGESFRHLKETYIIFLCLNDPFSRSKPIYTIEPVCQEDILVEIDCKIHWIALNAQAFNQAPVQLSHLLEYIKTNNCLNDALVQKIDKLVKQANQDPEKVMQMTTVQDRYDEFQRTIDEQAAFIKQQSLEYNKQLKTATEEIELLKKQLSKYESLSR